jgi:hypothetical protein
MTDCARADLKRRQEAFQQRQADWFERTLAALKERTLPLRNADSEPAATLQPNDSARWNS